MTTLTQLELILPGALWPQLNTRAAIWQNQTLPALAKLYGTSRKSILPLRGRAAYLASLAGLAQLPAGPILAAHYQAQTATPLTAGYWLLAEPVHLRLERDHLTVLGEPYLACQQAEAEALVDSLNGLYGADGWQFIAISPSQWLLRLPADPQLEFVPLDQALNRDLNDVLPAGPKALQFHALLNEMQMLLYQHPVNDARDAAGQPLVHSVWLSGGGVYPADQDVAVPAALYADDVLLNALGAQATVPGNFAAAQGLNISNACVLLDDLRYPAIYGEGYQWQQIWLRWEADWLAPALAALQAGSLTELCLTLPNTGEQCRIRRGDLWRFWRRPALPIGPLTEEG
ncbi:hypothetical protein [Chitinibacter tainanensis]|uniref:hypothetical protein n=1 Tax=Chitinibacter tainanensis TaxID=230667 RepID=UPI0023557282|nr:hypothetical protein [Chitinibacter tainanensis]